MNFDKSLDLILKSDFIVCMGTLIAKESDEMEDSILQSIADNDSDFIFMHPMEDEDVKIFCTQYVKYEVGSEEGVISLLLNQFLKGKETPIVEYLDDLDIGYISAESSLGEEEVEEFYEKSLDSNSKVLILGDDVFNHPRISNILKMLKALKEFAGFQIVCVNEENYAILDNLNSEAYDLEDVEDISSYNGTVLHLINSEELEDDYVYGSSSFCKIAKIQDGNQINVVYKGNSFASEFKVDEDMQGNIALCSIHENSKSFTDGYRYKQIKIQKVDA